MEFDVTDTVTLLRSEVFLSTEGPQPTGGFLMSRFLDARDFNCILQYGGAGRENRRSPNHRDSENSDRDDLAQCNKQP